ncbi:MAG: hypothetical protein QXM55_05425, partial [Ignisphaera sp.]
MENKIIVTTSRRPTPTVRRFVKYLVAVLPSSQYQRRGKLSFSMLALQAIDLNIDKLIVIRNRKGNPGYMDIYQVNHVKKVFAKFCTLFICGYSINTPYHKVQPKNKPKNIVILEDVFTSIDDEEIAECLLLGFNIKVLNKLHTPVLGHDNHYVVLEVVKMFRKVDNYEKPIYEITFKNIENKIVGPVI